MIDLHCHLLPGIDDGPPDMAAAIELARAQVSVDVQSVVCTPHVNWDMPNTAGGIEAGVLALRDALAEAQVPLEISAGAEVGLTRAAELSDEVLKRLRLGSSEWLLLEAPLSVDSGVERAVAGVASRGHRILLAHPERSPAFQRDIGALRRLVEGMGIRTQVTASAFGGAFGRTVQRHAEELLREGLVHVVASDAHDAQRRRPGLQEPMRDSAGAAWVAWATQQVPAATLANEALPPAPDIELPRRSRWRRR